MNDVIKAIDELVDIIYTPDKVDLLNSFIRVIETISAYVNQKYEEGITIDLNNEFMELQNAFTIKDYILLSDILLYKIKSEILVLEELEN